MPTRGTSPLDMNLPWVIELRVVGTAETIQMQLHEMIVIGREDPNAGSSPHIDLTPYQAYANGVSRRHAAILVNNGRVSITDLNSTNGTLLNGFDLTPGQEYRLRHDDELVLGQLRLQVVFTVMPKRETDTHHVVTGDVSQVAPVGGGQSVLIVEDDQDVGAVFSLALQQAGYAVRVVDNVTHAISELAVQMPDLIVLDLMLPDTSGLDLLHYLQKHQLSRVPTLVVSGATGGFQMTQALQAGATRFLGKPITIEDLIYAVSEAVAPAT